MGTRPEVIKLASVIAALRDAGDTQCLVALTGQHRELLDQALKAFGLGARFDLGLMRRDQTIKAFMGRALPGLGRLLRRTRPDLVIVQGDTATALCGALAAFQECIPVAHVEAGLRTFDLASPFPEEGNRRLIDALAELLFAPTPQASRNLAGSPRARVFVTGNTAVDAVRWAAAHPRPVRDPALAGVLAGLRAQEALILVTLHRRESFDGALRGACAALRALLEERPEAHIVFPVHLNPKVQSIVRRALRHPRAHLLAPLDYPDLVTVLRRCRFVMTDSGGLQEEAPSLGKPVLVLRRVTERPEAVRAAVARVVGFEPASIIGQASRLLDGGGAYRRMARRVEVFGDGQAGRRIAAGIRWFFGLSRRPADFRPKSRG